MQSDVDYDVQSGLEYDLNTLTSKIGTARSDIATLDNDLATLSASGLPAPAGVDGSNSGGPASDRAGSERR